MLPILYAVAIAVLTIYGSNLLWMAATHANRDRLRDGRAPEPGIAPDPLDEWPCVTVQLPVYNEPHVIERLIDAAARFEYPCSKLEIQVLDDSTDRTSALAAERAAFWRRRGVNIVHVQRVDRDGFKAGALQNGLQIAGGDFIAIFDADFVPQPEFLQHILPYFFEDGAANSPASGERGTAEDGRIGLVQARWGHINAAASWLTRIQSIGLDAHFAIEQRVRAATGCFMNFNGTAGVWRRSCIEQVGGWQGDTIAEDLDLSYRAQLAGWRFRYVDDLEVPAELPPTMSALRTQQFRWAKGSVETARKLLRPLWTSSLPAGVKLQGTIHLTAHVVFPFVLIAALLHVPLLAAKSAGLGPGEIYFGWMSFGLVGFAGFALAQMMAQRHLYFDWRRRLQFLPAFMAGSIGLALNNSLAVAEALAGRRTPFIRTPKFGEQAGRFDRSAAAPRRAAVEGHIDGASHEVLERPAKASSILAFAELGMLIYSIAGLVVLVVLGEWFAVPFQLLFTAGFALVTAANYRPDAR